MKSPIIIIGIGELGGAFACGFLRLGHPVYPVTHATPVATAAEALPEPKLVLVAVAEGDLPPLLKTLPGTWRGRLGLSRTSSCPITGKGFPHLR